MRSLSPSSGMASSNDLSSFPSFPGQNLLALGPETGVFPWVENSSISPKLACQFYWPFFDDIGGEHAVSLRSIGTYDVKVRLIFALCPRSIGLRGEILYIGMSI